MTSLQHPNPVHARIRGAFDAAMAEFNQSPAIRFLLSGEFEARHYNAILRQFYHYTKENPQMQALAAVYFRGTDRQMVKPFMRHAISEVGHDHMALDDLEALGEDTRGIATENPLPTTIALTAFPFYQIQYQNPIGYLGYLYFLEHMPTIHGTSYAAALIAAGIPESGLGFLKEHMSVDMVHTRLMENYLDALVHDDSDVADIVYALQVGCQLYAQMLWGAIQHADKVAPYGFAGREVRRQRIVATATAGEAGS